LTFIISLIATGFACPAQSQSQILPNGVEFVGDTNTLAPGSAYNVTVQITIDGANLKSEGVRVYFLSSNDSDISAPMGTYVLTDPSGKATYIFTTGNGTGNVTLTATALNTNSGITAKRTFSIGSYGTITGYTVDQAGASIGNAPVTLYLSNGTGKGSKVQSANNPQVSSSDGSYRFDKVPVGTYYLEAVKGNGSGSSISNIVEGSQAINIRIYGYNVTPSVTPTASPSANASVTPSAEPTSTPTATPTTAPTATPVPANDQQAIGTIVAGLVIAILILIGILLYRLFTKK
jgi:hypothetical protein